MKIHEYNEMMAYLTRPAVNRVGFAKRGYVKLTPAEKAAAYAARTPTQTLVKEANIKKLFDSIFKNKNWGGIRGKKRGTGGIFPDDWFRKHIAKAIAGDSAALKDLSRITGRSVKDLKNAFVKREPFLDKTRSIAAKESFPPERKLTPEKALEKEQKIKLKRKNRLAITSGGKYISNTDDFPFHHIMPIGGETALTTKDVAIISKQMNSKLAPYNTKLNDIADTVSDLYTTRPEGFQKRIDQLQTNAEQIIDKVKKELPKKYQGLIGFTKLEPIYDENGQIFRLQGNRIGIDETKTIGGKLTKTTNLADMSTKEIKALIDKAPKFKANMVPGLENLIKSVEAMPDDFRAKRYWTLGLKGLGIAAVPLVAHDGYTAIRDGLPPDEVVAKALLGADKLLYKGKEILQLTPEEEEARKVVQQAKMNEQIANDFSGLDIDFDSPPIDSDFTLEEAKAKLKEGQDRYADFREKKDAARASERAGIAKWYKDRIFGVPLEEVTREWNNQGGRVGFDKGSKPKSPGRRTFLKGITALAALPIVGKYFKLGKVLSKAGTYTGPAIQKIKGMPEWFPQLVKKLWNEGEDVTKQVAFKDRQVVKRGTLEGGDDVDMIYDLDTGNVSINVAPKKGTYETTSGAYNKEYGLDYTKGQADEMTKGKKPPDEFEVAELEGRTDSDAMDVDWEGKMTTVDDAMSDLTELEAFAKNKTTTQIHKKKGTKPKDVFPDYDYDPLDDY